MQQRAAQERQMMLQAHQQAHRLHEQAQNADQDLAEGYQMLLRGLDEGKPSYSNQMKNSYAGSRGEASGALAGSSSPQSPPGRPAPARRQLNQRNNA